jgi:hypothetical protein
MAYGTAWVRAAYVLWWFAVICAIGGAEQAEVWPEHRVSGVPPCYWYLYDGNSMNRAAERDARDKLPFDEISL